MDNKTKKSRKLKELKRLVLNSNGIRRSEAAELVDLDIRTASAYLEELVAGGLLRSETEPSGGKGRPGVLYYPNRENLCYLGLVIMASLDVSCFMIDHQNHTLDSNCIKFDRTCSKLTVFKKVLDVVRQTLQEHPERRLGAIGISISRWLQPPLASYDLYSGLVDYLSRETGVPVYRDVNINMLAYQASVQCKCRNLAVIHPGKVIEFGLVINGFPAANLFEHEDWLAHLQVDKAGRKCYCGQHGCLENYVTEGAVAERREELPPPEHSRIQANIERCLGMACREVARVYHPEMIMVHAPKEWHDGILRHYGADGPPLSFEIANFQVGLGAAMLAAFLSTKQFIKETTGEKSK